MFGGFGISHDGLTLAIVADLGAGETLWLKADADSVPRFEAAGCERFSYEAVKNGEKVKLGMNYYSAPAEALESPQLMLEWARLSWQSALKAQAAKAPRKPRPRAAAKSVAAPRKHKPSSKPSGKT